MPLFLSASRKNLPRSSPRCRLQALNGYWWPPVIMRSMGAFQRLVLFYHFALRTIIYGLRFPGSIVERRTGPPDSPSPPPYLAHPRSPTYLPRFIPAPRSPTPQGTYTFEGCCVWILCFVYHKKVCAVYHFLCTPRDLYRLV